MNFAMRRSRVLEKLRAGETVTSFKCNLMDARATEIAAIHGFDCIWLCNEHIANDWSSIEKQVYAAKAYDVDVACRIARGSYSDYIRALELDATGLIVPHVMNLDDARNVVRMCRFQPIGRRAYDGGNADGLYCNVTIPDYIDQANRERFLILQIEDPEVLPDLDAIAALDGVDMLFFGPADFSHAIGHAGEFTHPTVVETRRRVAEAAARHGKVAATTATPATRAELLEIGYRFLNMGSDVGGLSQHCRAMAEASGITVPNLPVRAAGAG